MLAHYSSRFRTILVGGAPFRIWKYPQKQQVSVILPEKPIVEVQLQLPGVGSFKAVLRNSEVIEPFCHNLTKLIVFGLRTCPPCVRTH
jgi:hypothetical protein